MLRRAALQAAKLAACRALQQGGTSTSYALQPALAWQPGLQRCRLPPTHVALRSFAAAPEGQENLWKTEACSLHHSRPIETARDETVFKRMLLRLFGFYTRESRLLRGAKALHAAIQEQAASPALYETLGLEQRFANTHSLLCLYVWMTLVRLRAEGRDGKDLAQMLYEDFQDNVEHRVRAEGVKVRISKWLKDLETMFYGSSLAYDKALQGGRGLGEALLRNVYGGDAARGADAEALARYVRRELDCLALTESADVMTGQLRFSAARLARPAAAPPAARPAGLGAAEQRGVGPDAEAQFAG